MAPSSRLPAMPKVLKRLRLAGLAALVLACGACGFHPRNAISVPPELGPVRVVALDPYSPLAESLADAMTRAGAVPAAPDSMDPAATLQIVSERWGNTPISIDQLGRAQEFSLRYAVMFTFVDAQGEEVVPRQVVELSRDYLAPPRDATGQASERELLGDELRRDMTSAILRRIGAALNVTRPELRGASNDGAADASAATTTP